MRSAIKILLGIIFLCVFVSQMLAQSILKDGRIPKDLVITLSLSSTIQFAARYNYRITADGEVFFEDHSTLLPSPDYGDLTLLIQGKNKPLKLKKPKLKDKLSKKQIKRIILDFEKSGFFEMNESYYGDPNLQENVCVNHANSKGLSISGNGKSKNVAFFLGCSYSENSPLKSFLSLYDKVSKELGGVKKINLKNQQTIKSRK